jgi:hypothetical protein
MPVVESHNEMGSSPGRRSSLPAVDLFWFGIALLMGWRYGVLNLRNLWPSFVLAVMAAAHALCLSLWTPRIFYLVGKYLNRSSNRVRYMPFFILAAVPFVFLQSGIQSVLIPPFDDVQQKYLAGSFHACMARDGSGRIRRPDLHLIENAIRHGVSCAREGGWVAVAANQKDGSLEIQVRNSVAGRVQAEPAWD